MKIIIPMAGSGQRFKDKGYKDPKPLIKVFFYFKNNCNHLFIRLRAMDGWMGSIEMRT